MDRGLLAKAIEAILLAAGRTVRVRDLREVFPGISESELEEILRELSESYRGRGMRIREVAGGWRLETAPEVAEYVRIYLRPKPRRLSPAALETLAVVAYRQPVTRAEIEAARGVDSSGPLRFLLETGFVRVVGRKEVPGRPLLYGTTNYFLEFFGLKSLQDLPPLEEIRKLAGRT
ncbi:SMC-Scp complex subunit ScpB [Thermosulfurimonas sp. F29]|uniref:SMC-Scp complex subunit ScpB n=1 Tax=Thermosulfurimonas sp. F29 TaxID=2867247 RepID=UPI001C829436|nr:SMC-Scp complex subunit ScpB [Thermosulfurimonas sp. F29]MBX6422486.1 SMC-Scp complex subunit ScpB [Thermosulfurimonas sp. F29]